MRVMNSKKWIRLENGAEYSTDFDFFVENQISCIENEEGTQMISRIEARTFYRTSVRKLDPDLITMIFGRILNDLCALKYGGRLID